MATGLTVRTRTQDDYTPCLTQVKRPAAADVSRKAQRTAEVRRRKAEGKEETRLQAADASFLKPEAFHLKPSS
jgi:hypothetical protein